MIRRALTLIGAATVLTAVVHDLDRLVAAVRWHRMTRPVMPRQAPVMGVRAVIRVRVAV